jgi:hypothetical protein
MTGWDQLGRIRRRAELPTFVILTLFQDPGLHAPGRVSGLDAETSSA